MSASIPASQSPEPTVLTRDSAAAYLELRGYPITAKRLSKLAHEGGGPEYRRWGHRAVYRPADLLTWAEARASAPKCHSSGHEASEAA